MFALCVWAFGLTCATLMIALDRLDAAIDRKRLAARYSHRRYTVAP